MRKKMTLIYPTPIHELTRSLAIDTPRETKRNLYPFIRFGDELKISIRIQNLFIDFYKEMEVSKKIGNRAQLFKKLEGLSPSRENHLRIERLVLSKLLSDYPSKPCILYSSFAFISGPLEGWVKSLKEKTAEWQSLNESFKYKPESFLKLHQEKKEGKGGCVLVRQSSSDQKATLTALLENTFFYLISLENEKEQQEAVEGVVRELEAIYTNQNIYNEEYFMVPLEKIARSEEMIPFINFLKAYANLE